MYEHDITDFTDPHQIGDCPRCGYKMLMYPFAPRLKTISVRLVNDYGYKCSYRLLRCKNEHMIVVIGAYTTGFDFLTYHRLRRFEIRCDDEWDEEKFSKEVGDWDTKYMSDYNPRIMNIIKFCQRGIKLYYEDKYKKPSG